MSAELHVYRGRCHCGALGFAYSTPLEPAQWAVRACQCSFCRAHGARTTADPGGTVRFQIADASKLGRYRFGTRSSDFLVCGDCGTYVAALLTSSRGQFATLNINTISGPLNVPEAQPVFYDGESIEAKRSRREQRWTPVVETVWPDA